MEKILSTVVPEERVGIVEWMKEFRVGILAPKQSLNEDRSKDIMNMWTDERGRLNSFEYVILALDKSC